MRPKLLRALNALLANNPFEEVDEAFVSLTEMQPEKEFSVEVEVNLLTCSRELQDEREELYGCYGEVLADKELVYQTETNSMRAMLKQIKAFLEAID